MRDDSETIHNIELKAKKKRLRRLLAYNSYFEGYTEIRKFGKNGKKKGIERVYTDDFIIQDVQDRVWKAYRIVQPLLYIISVILYAAAGNIVALPPSVFYIVVPGMMNAIVLVFEFLPVMSRIFAARRMKKWDFRSGPKRVKFYSLLSSCFLCVCAISSLVYAAIAPQVRGMLASSALYFAAFASNFALYLSERKTRYIEAANDTPTPLEGVESEWL